MTVTFHGIYAEQKAYAEAIAALGVRVALDPRRAEPPCALVVPQSAEFSPMTLACDGLAPTRWAIWVLAGQPGGIDAMRQLSAQTGMILAGMETGQATVELTSYSTDTGEDWPAMKIEFVSDTSDWIGAIETGTGSAGDLTEERTA